MMKSFVISSMLCFFALVSYGQCADTYATISPTACNTFISPKNQVLTSSGTYYDTLINAGGCDSIITIHLTLHLSTSTSFYFHFCGNAPAPFFHLVGDSAVVISTQGDQINLQTIHGCDSTLIFTFQHDPVHYIVIDTQACDSFISYSGHIYYHSGNYVEIFSNIYGCDSAVEYQLALNSLNPVVSQEVNNTALLSVDISNASYQWIDCNTNLPIPNAMNQTYEVTVNGDYACIVMQNNCTDTSNCIRVSSVGMKDLKLGQFQLYPNPAKALFVIENSMNLNGSEEIIIYDISSKIVKQLRFQTTINIEALEKGVYIIAIRNKDQLLGRQKLIVE